LTRAPVVDEQKGWDSMNGENDLETRVESLEKAAAVAETAQAGAQATQAAGMAGMSASAIAGAAGFAAGMVIALLLVIARD
jgi:hypothetical protein